MNYIKNNVHRLTRFVKTSVTLTALAPMILSSSPALAMFKTPLPKGSNIKSLISKFEGLSSTTSPTSSSPLKNPKSPLLPKPIPITGIKYPYKPESSSSTSTTKISKTSIQASATKPKPPSHKPFSLTITSSPSPEDTPINISDKKIKDLEVLLKGNIASIVKENLPKDFKGRGPIEMKFDKESGKELSKALSRFIYFSTTKTLESLPKQ